jgi:hypothetical protein
VRERDFAHSIYVQYHHLELIPYIYYGLNIRNSVLRKFANMNHPILARKNLHKCPERHNSNDPTCVLITNLNVFGKSINRSFSLLGILSIRRTNDNGTVILNINGDTKFLNHPADN